jgi:hypothetical protein
MDLISTISEHIRQWRYPKAFRIPATFAWRQRTDLDQILGSFVESIQALSDPEFLGRAEKFTAADDQGFIIDSLTRLWRVRKGMREIESEPQADAKRLSDQLDRLVSKFEEMDVRLEDREGELYDAGFAMKVIASEPMAGIGREIIKETYKPAIYRGDTLIQVPEVIIGLPMVESGEQTKDNGRAEGAELEAITHSSETNAKNSHPAEGDHDSAEDSKVETRNEKLNENTDKTS